MPINIKQATKDISVPNNDFWITETETNPQYKIGSIFDVTDITTFILKPKYHNNYAIVNTWQGNLTALANKPFKLVDTNKIEKALHQWLAVVTQPVEIKNVKSMGSATVLK